MPADQRAAQLVAGGESSVVSLCHSDQAASCYTLRLSATRLIQSKTRLVPFAEDVKRVVSSAVALKALLSSTREQLSNPD